MTTRNSPEQDLQRTVVAFLEVALPHDVWWTAVNPVPGKSKAARGISKAMGLRPGVQDLIFLYRGRFFAIELKSGKGRESGNQHDCAHLIITAGGSVHLCRPLPEVEGVLAAHGIPLRARLAA